MPEQSIRVVNKLKARSIAPISLPLLRIPPVFSHIFIGPVFRSVLPDLPAHEIANCSIVHGSKVKALSEYSDLVCFDECCLVHSLDQHLVMMIRQDRQNITKTAISIQIFKKK